MNELIEKLTHAAKEVAKTDPADYGYARLWCSTVQKSEFAVGITSGESSRGSTLEEAMSKFYADRDPKARIAKLRSEALKLTLEADALEKQAEELIIEAEKKEGK